MHYQSSLSDWTAHAATAKNNVVGDRIAKFLDYFGLGSGRKERCRHRDAINAGTKEIAKLSREIVRKLDANPAKRLAERMNGTAKGKRRGRQA